MSSNALIFFYLILNLLISISLVLINKWIYQRIRFPNLTLTLIHFIFTFFGLFICHLIGIFKHKKLSLVSLLPLAITFAGFVVFTNLSLEYNTVGTYQILKTLTMPNIIAIEHYLYKNKVNQKVVISIIPIIIGVFVNSYYDLKFNFLGLVFALIGVVITSFYQILVGAKQKQLKADSMQLLYYQSPISALILLCIIPLVEPFQHLFSHPWNLNDMFLVTTSGFFAFLINLSIYWIIGNTSAMTYNVFGQLKFLLTVVGGLLLFRDPLNQLQLIGIVLTFFGVAFYTLIKMKGSQKIDIKFVRV